MAWLKATAIALALALGPPAHAQPVVERLARWRPFVTEASTRFGIPTEWIERVMRAESGGSTPLGERPITSAKGAMGLMQIMPATWTELRAALGLGADPYDPRDNILAGAAYLRRMFDRFGFPGLFAAYNAGPGRYAEHLASGRPLPGETRAYLASVGGSGDRSEVVTAVPPFNPIFFASTGMSGRPTKGASKGAGLFVVLRSDVVDEAVNRDP